MMGEPLASARWEEECPKCGAPKRDHMLDAGDVLCPEFVVDLELLRIDAERAIHRYKTARNEAKAHEPR
jgi:uncharacterized Zn finger protein (UPF0148 family)